MEMPTVSECEVEDCAYNCDELCHAIAITVGDETHPMCDTFCTCHSDDVDTNCVAGVGACKTSVCAFNKGLECNASDISVGYIGDEVDCLTFKSR